MYKTFLLFAPCLLFSCQEGDTNDRLNIPWSAVAGLPPAPADHRLSYGPAEQQFGELRLPATPGPHPVVVFIHGGCWLAEYDWQHVGPVSADLARRGYAVWTPEYRRVGDPGGGWPNTFTDIGRAIDTLRGLAEPYALDLNNITVMGHSAGGHLALWQALRDRLPASSPLYVADPLPVHRVISLAGITDLAAYHDVGNSCSEAVPQLMDGSPAERPERYRQGSPIDLLPARVPLVLVHGTEDAIVPLAQSTTCVERAQTVGGPARLVSIPGGGHFDMVYPGSVAWEAVVDLLAAGATGIDEPGK